MTCFEPQGIAVNEQQTQVLVHRIKQLMAQQHLNQAQLADNSGVSRGAVSRLLAGETKSTTVETAEKLAGVFQKSVLELTERAFPIRRGTALGTLLNSSCLEILKRVGIIGVDLLTGGLSGVCTNSGALLKELANAQPPEMALTLLHLSMCGAIRQLFDTAPSQIQPIVGEAAKELASVIDEELTQAQIIADQTLFTEPVPEFVARMGDRLVTKLTPRLVHQGETEEAANLKLRQLAARLHKTFFERLMTEAALEHYSRLLSAIQESPFDLPARRERGWTTYALRFRNQLAQPLFEETFSIEEVHVPLRAWAYYELPGSGTPDDEQCDPEQDDIRAQPDAKQRSIKWGREVRHVADWFEGWLAQVWDEQGHYHFSEAFRFLTGDPGSGKSTDSRMFAVRHMEGFTVPGTKRTLRVLFVPLHQFDYHESLSRGLGHFCRLAGLAEHPLSEQAEHAPLLLIFDGLDELARSGDLGVETAKAFVNDVRAEVASLKDVRQIAVLFCGRPISVDTANRERTEVFHLLPYLVPEAECKEFTRGRELVQRNTSGSRFEAIDQRQDWWNRYAVAQGQEPAGIPADLPASHPGLTDLTRVPMLNYLVALSRSQGFNFKADFNICSLYEHMLNKVWERGYQGRHRAVDGLTQEHFEQLLEEIALAAWHSAGRTVTVDKVMQGLQRKPKLLECLRDLNREVQGSGDAGGVLVRLFLAFYIQIEQRDPTQRTYEFTHKSFGEYLAARCLIRQLRSIFRQWNQRRVDPDDGGLDTEQALVQWLQLFGPKFRLTHDLFKFLCAELQHGQDGTATEPTYRGVRLSQFLLDAAGQPVRYAAVGLREFVNALINHVLQHGMPAQVLQGCTFQAMQAHAMHSEEALLALHFAVNQAADDAGLQAVLGVRDAVKVRRLPLDVAWPDQKSLGSWLARLNGTFSEPPVSVAAMRYLPLSHLHLWLANLGGANLVSANLDGANLGRANLRDATVERVALSNTVGRPAYLPDGTQPTDDNWRDTWCREK